jgi:hypothetical protein
MLNSNYPGQAASRWDLLSKRHGPEVEPLTSSLGSKILYWDQPGGHVWVLTVATLAGESELLWRVTFLSSHWNST